MLPRMGRVHVFLFLLSLCQVISSTAIPLAHIQDGQHQIRKRNAAQSKIVCHGDPSPVAHFFNQDQRDRIQTNQQLCASKKMGGDKETSMGGKCHPRTDTIYFDTSEADADLLQFWPLNVHCYEACNCLKDGEKSNPAVEYATDFPFRKSQSEPSTRPSLDLSTSFKAKAYLDHCKIFNNRVPGCKSLPSLLNVFPYGRGTCRKWQQFARLGLEVPQQCFQGG